ncbi:MAG: DUF3488 domain-containing transglutaminase family protein [Gluconacetobacter diazotrophicus]|nr:DUF3488 domain-containing transglutaminase family protein [Gluconacetobacter diazotrophicus]
MPTLTRPKNARRQAVQPRPVAPPQAFRLALPWLLGSLTATMATLIGQVPAWTLLSFGACAGWRLFAERRERALPSMLLRLVVFLPMALGLVVTYRGHVDAASMLAFLVALISLKVLELRSARDFTVVSLLGFFMMLSAFFYNQSFALFVYLSVILFANVVSLIRCHGVGQGRAVGPSLRLAVGMILQSLPLVVLMFIIFPRVQGSFLLRLSNPNTGLTGMSDHLQPGSFGSLVQSDDLAFRAQLNNANGTLPQNDLYWRALVLEIADSSMSWRATEQRRVQPRHPLPGKEADRVEQRITILPNGERWLYALDHPVDIRATANFPAQLSSGDSVRSDSPVYSKAIYTVVSDLAPEPVGALPPDRRHFYTKVPTDLGEQTLALARTWRRPGAQDEDVVKAGLAYLRNGGFVYTLTPGPMPADHALDYFLFQSRKGFCEHYAAAFASLMRAAGVPARIVVGYQGGELNTWGSPKYYTIRQSDAHAWCEVWLDGRGWVREDPTATIAPDRVSYGAEGYAALSSDSLLGDGSRLRKLNAPGPLRWLGHNALMAWDSFDQQWNMLVLGFDQEQQLNVLQRLNLGDLDLVGGTVLTFATAIALLTITTAGMRFLTRGKPPREDALVRVYGKFCRRLARAAGVVRRDNEGPLDFARRAGEALPAQAREIRRITDLYVASRYGPGNGADPAASLARAVRGFRPAAAAT